MITYLIGNPGSGKTYYAVYKIYELFLNPKRDLKNEYLLCYTNINQFKFELSDKFIKFDFDKFYDDLSVLYGLYLDKADDKKLNDKALELGLHKVVIVLDEAHNFLKAKKDEILIWWLTYHRHLYQDIYLITQDLSLVNSEYKRIAEFFYKAVDSSRRIFKNKLRYVIYGSYKLYNKDIYDKFQVPFNLEIYNLYHSGNNSNKGSVVQKMFLIAFIIFIILLVVFYLFINSMQGSDDNKSKSSSNNQATKSSSQTTTKALINNPKERRGAKSDKETMSEIYVYDISCFEESCFIKGYKNQFPRGFLDFLVASASPLYYYPYSQGRFNNYFLAFSTPILDNLKSINKGVTDEKNIKSSFDTGFFK